MDTGQLTQNEWQAVLLDELSLGPDITLAPLHNAISNLTCHEVTDAPQTAKRLRNAHIAIVNKVVIDRNVMEACPNLKLIAVMATGTNNVDLQAAREFGIRVVNVIRYGTASIVQHTFSLIMALAGNLFAYSQDVKQGAWSRSPTFCLMHHPMTELQGKVLGIIGYGDLGQGVAALARAMGMQVLIAKSPTGKPDPHQQRVPLDRLLEQSDIVSLHCLLSDHTRNLIDSRALTKMKREAFLINVARGGLVDEPALAQALEEGRIAGAALDVLSEEPPRNGNPLLELDMPNLIITPHCAWASREARQRVIELTADNIRQFINGTLSRFIV